MIVSFQFASQLIAALIATEVASLQTDREIRGLSVDNTHVIIHSDRMDRVVSIGPAAIRPLISEMRRPGVSLDTFIRCYSACDQILRQAGAKEPIHWHGGLIETNKKHTQVVKTSLLSGFSKGFRTSQIDEILHSAKEAGVVLTRAK